MKNHRLDAAALCQRLDRYERGNPRVRALLVEMVLRMILWQPGPLKSSVKLSPLNVARVENSLGVLEASN